MIFSTIFTHARFKIMIVKKEMSLSKDLGMKNSSKVFVSLSHSSWWSLPQFYCFQDSIPSWLIIQFSLGLCRSLSNLTRMETSMIFFRRRLMILRRLMKKNSKVLKLCSLKVAQNLTSKICKRCSSVLILNWVGQSLRLVFKNSSIITNRMQMTQMHMLMWN